MESWISMSRYISSRGIRTTKAKCGKN